MQWVKLPDSAAVESTAKDHSKEHSWAVVYSRGGWQEEA